MAKWKHMNTKPWTVGIERTPEEIEVITEAVRKEYAEGRTIAPEEWYMKVLVNENGFSSN